MLDLSSEVVASLNARTGVKARLLVQVTAKNRTTGLPEVIRLWTGDDRRPFTIGAESRDYLGAGGMVAVSDLVTEATLNIRETDVQLSPVAPEVIDMLRLYDPRFGAAEIHIAFFDPETDALIADPTRIVKGWVNKTPIRRPVKGQTGSARATIVGHTRMLTRTLAAKRSNENQKKRSGSDTFFIDVGMTGTVTVGWGSSIEPPTQNQVNNVIDRFFGGALK
jgi:hypothetical protein